MEVLIYPNSFFRILSVGDKFHSKVTSQTFNQSVHSKNQQVNDHQTEYKESQAIVLEPVLLEK